MGDLTVADGDSAAADVGQDDTQGWLDSTIVFGVNRCRGVASTAS